MADPILLDTAPLRDQRTMVDVSQFEGAHATPDQVAAAWQRWADREGLSVRRRAGDFSTELRRSRKVVVVHISAGKWVGNCPECNGGVAGWPFNPEGCCLDCGTIFGMEYPTEEEVRELVELLKTRPEAQRNYFPHDGETVDFVRREQAVYKFPEPTGAVSVASILDVLGGDALKQLRAAGVV